ncbi:hypothetical protein ROSINTL182_08716 [Roseburia intestinalis L1-82]|jgi:protein LTV1-like protein|uniref:Uncharacterized protein n=1 Tax=Roseburia intestinalis L1-82 TaxID=536231 RepID=C7GFK9_9FIRM|nr:hypothetical protein ROSINTL182_08716 [Roseburia intestinalis L1-82]
MLTKDRKDKLKQAIANESKQQQTKASCSKLKIKGEKLWQ